MPTHVNNSQVVLLCLSNDSIFKDVSADLLGQLESRAEVHEITDLSSVGSTLEQQPRPTVVLITDGALTTAKNAKTWDKVLSYVREGGTAVAMGQFSSFVRPDDIKPFFAGAGLPWEMGSYHRTTLTLNREAVGADLAAGLLQNYSQKAVSLKNVAATDAWYVTDGSSVIESLVFAPQRVETPDESPVIWAKVGDGRLGYIGDVNGEEGSQRVVLAMCGLS